MNRQRTARLIAVHVFPLLLVVVGSAGQDVLVRTAESAPSAEQEAEIGQSLFERNCAVSHGVGGTGGRGPNLNRALLSRAPDDTALRALIEDGILPEMPDGSFLSSEDVTNLMSYVRSLGKLAPQEVRGNAAHGKSVFVRNGCPTCHIVATIGAGFGPDLTAVSERRSTTYIRQAIVEPAANLPAEFLMVKATTLFGDAIQGIRVNEDTYSIQIRSATGDVFSFRKTDLKELQRLEGQTPMPSFEGTLTDTDLRDLVAFLESTEKTP